ncbi:MAG TPA: cysteine hydrolase [Gemmatimonadaceae bacterium]|jgi:nicotinamidase-related amidase
MTSHDSDQALLVMDVQSGVVVRIPDGDAYVARVRSAVEFARRRRIPVIYVVVGFRAGAPEVSTRNKAFSNALKQGATFPDAQPVIRPEDGDVVVVKRRVSAFTGSDLEVVLRAKNIQHLVLTGIATGGVVLSTLREAADKDYRLTVLSDLCADSDAEVHNVLINKIFPRQADVVSSAEWMIG